MYFATQALYNYFIAHTEFALAFTLATGTATGKRAYDFVLPRCVPPDDTVEVSGVDSDIIETFSFRTLVDAASAAQIQVTRRTIA